MGFYVYLPNLFQVKIMYHFINQEKNTCYIDFCSLGNLGGGGEEIDPEVVNKTPTCNLKALLLELCRDAGFNPRVSEDPLEEEMATHSSILV